MKETKRCSFCFASQKDILLIEKPGVLICAECVSRFSSQIINVERVLETKPSEKCSFCSWAKGTFFLPSTDKGYKLVGGPGNWICDGCLEICQEIITEKGTL